MAGNFHNFTYSFHFYPTMFVYDMYKGRKEEKKSEEDAG